MDQRAELGELQDPTDAGFIYVGAYYVHALATWRNILLNSDSNHINFHSQFWLRVKGPNKPGSLVNKFHENSTYRRFS